jgi:IgGFc binding protein
VAKTNETVVTNLIAGQFCDIIVDGPVQFQANQPIQVAQFANGTYSDHGNTPYEGDPCEILLPPVGHWLVTNIVITLTNDLPNQVIGDFNENHLNLIVA